LQIIEQISKNNSQKNIIFLKTSEEGWLHNAIKKSKINTVVTVSAHQGQASGLCGRLAQYVYPEDVYTCKRGKNYGVKVDIKGSTDI
jgi:hypothetical protein